MCSGAYLIFGEVLMSRPYPAISADKQKKKAVHSICGCGSLCASAALAYPLMTGSDVGLLLLILGEIVRRIFPARFILY